jgi:hypothetical protein
MKRYFLFFLTMNFIGTAHAFEVQCNLFDGFNKYQGSMLIDYDERNKILVLSKTVGENLIFLEGPNGWIAEARGKRLQDISTDPNIIFAQDDGRRAWSFKLNRANGAINVIQQTYRQGWKGNCTKVDRSNKF